MVNPYTILISVFTALSIGFAYLYLSKYLIVASRGIKTYFAPDFPRRKVFWGFVDRYKASKFWDKILSIEAFEKNIEVAGLGKEWSSRRFLNLKILGLYSWLLLILLPATLSVFTVDSIGFVLSIVLFVAVIYWPNIFVRSRIKRRKSEVNLKLFNLINLLALQVSAGTNLEQAFRRLPSDLGETLDAEIRHLRFQTEAGVSFDTALEAVRKRLDVPDFSKFVFAIKQAKNLGTTLNAAFRIQKDMLQMRRRQKAEKLAKTAAVKITLPLVVFIFPALMIVFLAPAIITLMKL